MLVNKALQFEHPELLTCTLTPLADVASHVLLLEESSLILQEYEPTWITLIDPPYEFAPLDSVTAADVAVQLLQLVRLTTTTRFLAEVAPQADVLLLAEI